MTTRITGAVQESLIALTCFDEVGSSVVGTVPLICYESFYRKLAEKVYDYWQQFRCPPKDHTLDLIDELIEEHNDDSEVYRRIYYSVLASKDGINTEYVLGKAGHFVRQQRIKQAFTDAVPLIQRGDLDEVEALMMRSLRSTETEFHPGTEISDIASIFRSLDQKIESYPIGIPALDSRDLGPARKELWLFIASAKAGKTWMCIHLAKRSMLEHKKVLHVTLEMSEARMSQRYLQSLFSVSKRAGDFRRMKFKVDEHGSFLGMDDVEIPVRPSFADGDIQKRLGHSIRKWKGRLRLWIKQFPTGALTIPALRGYLDRLEVVQKFIPDLLIVDYADLMEVDPRHKREYLGKIYQDLRGIGVERNIAVMTPTQGGRASATAQVVRATHVSEDWSKIATADVIMTYSQTDAERKLGLARILVAGGRNDEDKFQVLIAQNYGLGQFCLDSARMNSRYDDLLKSFSEECVPDAPVRRKKLKRK